VIVSMGGYAASGGYYISAPGTRVFANASSITGSIGVFYGKADVSRLLDRIGVDVEVYKTTEHADADAFYRPYTSEERAQGEHQLREFYDLFVSRVAEGRKLDKAAVDAIGQGRVWTGEQAKDKGLVDEIGGLRQALAYARRLGGLSEEAPIVELPRIESSLIGRLLGVSGSVETGAAHAGADPKPSAEAGAVTLRSLAQLLPNGLIGHADDVVNALTPFLLYSSEQPLMRLEDFTP
jgi:protease-4